MREELGVKVPTLNEVDRLVLDFHIELSAKWYKYTSTHQIEPNGIKETNLASCGADAQTEMGKP